ncbi:lysozyme inhibitor LprI family protein [Nioella aestuarii]|uniref:lysozyme inhibitor LprI family protein n=1 Tax=Nioella aestuarii TaxID=1662864 RepID=UPI003D7F70D1
MLRTTIILALLFFAPAALAQSWCSNGPLNATEQAICSTPDLGWRDQELEQAYAAVRQMPGVQTDQQAWLSDRNSCGGNVNCIRAAYDTRIAALQAMAQGGGKPTASGPLYPTGPAWCTEGSLNPAEQTICGNSELGQMDLYMADLYAQVRHLPGIVSEQQGWLRARNACYSDYPCLYAAYSDRIQELQLRYGAN